jgi:3-carboxy-cis,cis-muconate cycloisomerase
VKADDPEAAKFVHWGATSQDIIDTATVLQLRDALDVLEPLLDEACASLATLARAHRATPMIGRTWLQQALPSRSASSSRNGSMRCCVIARASPGARTRAGAAVRRGSRHAREPARTTRPGVSAALAAD